MIALEATYRATNLVICVDDGGGYYELDLVPRHVYEVVPDDSLDARHIRVVDETGEDYVYPASYFVLTDDELERDRPTF